MARLRALWMLARCGTIAAAANALHLTASAVSQQLAQLEAETGMALTERKGRGVRLTVAGERLVQQTERLMHVLDEAWAEMADLRKDIVGELRIAAFPTVASAIVPMAIKKLRAEHPRLALIVEEMEPVDAAIALRSWLADVVFLHDLLTEAPRKLGSLATMPILEDRLYALLPQQHALASKAYLHINQLRDESWAFDSSHSTYEDFLTQLCWRGGFEPRVNARCRGYEMVAAMVASNCSVSVVPGLRLTRPLADVTAVPLRPAVRRTISIAYRKGDTAHPAIQAFVTAIRAAAGTLHASGLCRALRE